MAGLVTERPPDLFKGVRLWREDPDGETVASWLVEVGVEEQPSVWIRLEARVASGGRYELLLADVDDDEPPPHVAHRFHVVDDDQAVKLVDLFAHQIANGSADPRREWTGWWANAIDATADAIRTQDPAATPDGDGWTAAA